MKDKEKEAEATSSLNSASKNVEKNLRVQNREKKKFPSFFNTSKSKDITAPQLSSLKKQTNKKTDESHTQKKFPDTPEKTQL